jgi:peptidoglycan/xylan/chitin deacetylase (PgdA/CDA1 family)
MAAKDIKVCYGVDLDAVAGWLGSYGGEDSPDDISRGVWSAQVGVANLLELFSRYDIKATWFVPGHSIETFPAECENIVKKSHEIGLHGYSHENPIAMTAEQEEKVLVRCISLIERFTGRRPTGYRAPWWEFSNATVKLLLKHGVRYDSSLMHRDFEAYYVRTGDRWYPIDYTKDPDSWMKPMEFGTETELIEIPANWYLDDLPPTMFIKKAPNSFGWVSPNVLFDMWKAQFDFLYRKGKGVFPLTIHPDTSGRPQMIVLLHERLIPYILDHSGVSFCTYDEYALEWQRGFGKNSH